MPDEPRLYTRAVARKIVKRELCAQAGHQIERHCAENVAGRMAYDFYGCNGCDIQIVFVYPELEGA